MAFEKIDILPLIIQIGTYSEKIYTSLIQSSWFAQVGIHCGKRTDLCALVQIIVLFIAHMLLMCTDSNSNFNLLFHILAIFAKICTAFDNKDTNSHIFSIRQNNKKRCQNKITWNLRSNTTYRVHFGDIFQCQCLAQKPTNPPSRKTQSGNVKAT